MKLLWFRYPSGQEARVFVPTLRLEGEHCSGAPKRYNILSIFFCLYLKQWNSGI